MRTGSLASQTYAPSNVPADPKALPRFLTEELARIKAALDLAALGHVDTTHVEPTKPREGDIRLADGTDWNPGGGAGVYAYYGGAWVKLG